MSRYGRYGGWRGYDDWKTGGGSYHCSNCITGPRDVGSLCYECYYEDKGMAWCKECDEYYDEKELHTNDAGHEAVCEVCLERIMSYGIVDELYEFADQLTTYIEKMYPQLKRKGEKDD